MIARNCAPCHTPAVPTPRAYYNEIDPKAAAWLRELIAGGHIAAGTVDERSIEDVQPDDLKGFTQCHFFAGIGGWSYALRLAGWTDDRPVWTGSCPCQPFSAAGKRGGTDDARHIWPQFYRLIGECRPATVFGEQVASKDGLAWLDTVSTDLERADYAVGAADMCAAGVGAPHIRQRLWFVADGDEARRRIERGAQLFDGERTTQRNDTNGRGENGNLAESESEQHDRRGDARRGRGQSANGRHVGNASEPRSGRDAGAVFSAESRSQWGVRGQPDESELASAANESGNADHARPQGRGERWHGADQRSPWAAELVDCRDGKRRPIEPGTFPLAHGVSNRVGKLRGYGNAIVPQVAAEVIRAYMEC